MLPLFIFATTLEAEFFFHKIQFSLVRENLWKSNSCYLLICGVGSLSSSIRLIQALGEIPRPQYLVNMGCVASLSHFDTFDCMSITKVTKYLERGAVDDHSDQFFQKIFPSFELPFLPQSSLLPQANLLTVDCPFHNTEDRNKLSPIANVLDMEGYGLATAAKEAALELHMIKCVSDFGRDGGFEELRKNLKRCSHKLFSIAEELLQK